MAYNFKKMFGKRAATFLVVLSTVSSLVYQPIFTPKAEAFLGFGDIVIDIKELVKSIASGIAQQLAQRMIDDMTKSTIKWAQSGFDGNPAYVTNPKQYFTDIANGVAGEFIAGSDLKKLCSPFQNQIKLALRQANLQENQFQCTLTEVVDNIDAFYHDFDQGGWDAWFSMTQNSANNPYGALISAQLELDKRSAEALALEDKNLNWNNGFLSFSDCVKVNPPAMIPDGNGGFVANPASVPGKVSGECIENGPTKTPGSVIQGQLDKVLGGPIQKLAVAENINQLISSFANGLLTRYVFGSKGLFGDGSNKSNSGSGASVSSRTGRIDIDGDNVPDGQDSDQDGKLESKTDVCYHRGTPPNCVGSGSVTSSPYFTPICQAIDGAVLSLTDFAKFIDSHADQIEGGSKYKTTVIGSILGGPVGLIYGGLGLALGSGNADNFKNKADANIWGNRISEVNSAVNEISNSIQTYKSPYFDDVEITTNRFAVYVDKVMESLMKDKDLDLSAIGGGGGGLENLMKNVAYNLRYFQEVKTKIGKCDNPNIAAADNIPLPPSVEPGVENGTTEPPPPPPVTASDGLSVSKSSGTAPLNNIILTANKSEPGQYYHYFYCDRAQTDTLPPVPSGFINTPQLISTNTYISPVACNYPTARTYHPKVITLKVGEGGTASWSQANATVVVQ